MQILKSFEDPELIAGLVRRIGRLSEERPSYCFMEVCGTHTQAIGRWGIRRVLPDNIRLVSGPGCPVCVTPAEYIDNAAALGLEHDCVLVTFGDLLRVPGLQTSLAEARGHGADIRTVYSPADALRIADETAREVVFLAIGFETTTASIAAAMQVAHATGLRNLSFYCSLRTVPAALSALLADKDLALDGFLLPGHVSVIIGTEPYKLLEHACTRGVIAGFEPVDILRGIEHLLFDVNNGTACVRNLYRQAVHRDGNPQALKIFRTLFDVCDSVWRGIGLIAGSGFRLRDEFIGLDAERRFELPAVTDTSSPGCVCGDVLRGFKQPPDCALFGKACTPSHPVGPCMVSTEGSCSAHYKYEAAT